MAVTPPIEMRIMDSAEVRAALGQVRDEIERLKKENEDLRSELEEARDRYDWLLGQVGGTV